MAVRIALALVALASAMPAWAREGAAVPEGSNLTINAQRRKQDPD